MESLKHRLYHTSYDLQKWDLTLTMTKDAVEQTMQAPQYNIETCQKSLGG